MRAALPLGLGLCVCASGLLVGRSCIEAPSEQRREALHFEGVAHVPCIGTRNGSPHHSPMQRKHMDEPHTPNPNPNPEPRRPAPPPTPPPLTGGRWASWATSCCTAAPPLRGPAGSGPFTTSPTAAPSSRRKRRRQRRRQRCRKGGSSSSRNQARWGGVGWGGVGWGGVEASDGAPQPICDPPSALCFDTCMPAQTAHVGGSVDAAHLNQANIANIPTRVSDARVH